ncbi:MAG: HAMP domain-containing sensor histidine kinase [Acidiferrobacterales bacterium]
MIRTLYGKLVAALLGLLLLVAFLLIPMTQMSTSMYQQEVSQKLNRELADNLVHGRNLIQQGVVNEAALKKIFGMYMVINPSIEIYLLDTRGQVMAHSAPLGKVKRSHVDLAPIHQFISSATQFPITGDNPRDPTGQKVFSAAAIRQQGKLQGYLYVILGSDRYDGVVELLSGSYILKMSAWAGASGLLVVLVVGLLLFAWLTRRLSLLTREIDKFSKSKFSDAINFPVDRSIFRDEIDRLGQAFNKMSGRIMSQVQRLTRNDNLRRELVANVSHDLRTPLASLQGYLETLRVKEATLSDTKKREYLDVALKHCQHLAKLIGDLFDLAKLDAREVKLHCETFTLADLLQDVILKFKLQADSKNIFVSANVDKAVHFVCADIALMERVLGNLIDNALRYTPEGGQVTVNVTAQGQHIRICVHDSGTGIPADKLPFIFDRFYRIEDSTSNTHTGVGLGLAITKRIVELHGSSIKASSSPDNGTEISFDLPLHQTA